MGPLLLLVIASTPIIDVYTMGAGEHPFTRFGHAAICVTDEASPHGRCYNFGTADFSTPGPLTWRFIRGQALFWVSVADETRMLDWYRREDRTIWRQRLELTPSQAVRIADALRTVAREENRYYRYHHFRDNCTTRIRDIVDAAFDGAIFRATALARDSAAFREYARGGFGGNAPLLIATDLILGRAADAPTSTWEAMFHPDELRRVVAQQLGATPVALYERKSPLPSGPVWLGRATLVAAGALFAGLVAVTRKRGARALLGMTLGTAGAVLWALAALSDFPELIYNEVLTILVPLDMALVFLPPLWVKRYVDARLAGLGAVTVALAVGLFIQPLWPMLALAALPLFALRLSVLPRAQTPAAK